MADALVKHHHEHIHAPTESFDVVDHALQAGVLARAAHDRRSSRRRIAQVLVDREGFDVRGAAFRFAGPGALWSGAVVAQDAEANSVSFDDGWLTRFVQSTASADRHNAVLLQGVAGLVQRVLTKVEDMVSR